MAYFIGKSDDDRDIYGTDFDIEVKECKQTEDGKRIVSMVGSTPSVDRDGDTIRQQGWDIKSYKQNSVVLWGHNHSIPAIAKTNKLKKSADALDFSEIEFPKEGIHPFADMIFSLMEAKFIKAGSVGFIPTDMEKRDREDDEPDIGWCPTHFKKQELLEFSIVNVGSNRDALVTHLGAKGFETTGKVKIGEQEFEVKQLIDAIFTEDKEDKTVIPFKHYPLADEETTWNGPKERKEADVDQLKKMSTWFDGEKPDVKSSYKLHHHQASDLKTVWRGVRAAMGSLLGARGGVDVPEGDRKGIFQHLKSHYLEFDKEVPEFKAYEEAEFKEMFSELFEEKDVEGSDLEVEVIARYCVVVDEKDTFIDVPAEVVGGNNLEADPSKAPEGWKSVQFITTFKGEPMLTVDRGFILPEIKDSQIPLLTIKGIEIDGWEGDEGFVATKESITALLKAGAVLSRANKSKLKNASQAINDVLAAAEPAATDGGDSDDDKTQLPEEISLKDLKEVSAKVDKLTEAFAEILQELRNPSIESVLLEQDDTKTDPEKDDSPDNDILAGIESPEKDGDIGLDKIGQGKEDSDTVELKDIDSKQLIKEISAAIKSTVPDAVSKEFNRATGKVD